MSLVINHNQMASNAARNLNANYSGLSDSVRRLSSGLRVWTAADDAAGLAIRELMRADIAAFNQGIRNANDAISAVQTADGALQVIDEKIIRLKELAEQAATGTYNSDQRLMIDREFQAMSAEIDRIANSTKFNDIYLLNGTLQGEHNGSGLQSTGSMKVHFGTGNDSAEDYYYINMGDATTVGLGLMRVPTGPMNNTSSISDILENGIWSNNVRSGVVSFGFIPAGATNISITIDGVVGAEDDIQLFTRNGVHIVGTPMTGPVIDATWAGNPPLELSEENGFNRGAVYVDALPSPMVWAPPPITPGPGGANPITYNGMNINYSGCYDFLEDGNTGSIMGPNTFEQVLIDRATEDLVLIVTGMGIFHIVATWDNMPASGSPPPYDIQTQENAQNMLGKLSEAIIRKDQIRAHLGAMQNRLENTISNLQISAENLQTAESRISDVDVATEMTELVRGQILTQSSVAMLSQANSLPQMALQVIQG